ncbi:MAG: ABC transporter permease [Zoogloeaceae bacterium]|jgi:peptide/nickel transport system permease protein|nr:ABC transporter permease [Zoogloeaceae bacterium]
MKKAGSWLRPLAGRLLGCLIVCWGVATLTFAAIHFTARDPILIILGETGSLPTPEMLAYTRHVYGLDQPLIVQYGHYLWGLLHGDLGESWRLRIPVTQAISEQMGATVELAFFAAILSIVLAIGIAVLTAGRAAWVRGLVSGTELVVHSIPGFVLGILLLLVFSFQLHWLPSTGTEGWKTLVLPAATMAATLATSLSQVLRQELERVLEQPFVLMARARGASRMGVLFRHALRHALTPLVTLSGYIFANLLGGAVIMENLFSRQGIGRLTLNAVNDNDLPVVLGVTLLSALIYVLINALVDLLNVVTDPRIREG